MKVIAIGTLKELTLEQKQHYMPKQVPATLQIYLDGKIEQFWMRTDGGGAVFLLNVVSADEAEGLLNALPLTPANLMTFELLPVGPLAPLGMLIS